MKKKDVAAEILQLSFKSFKSNLLIFLLLAVLFIVAIFILEYLVSNTDLGELASIVFAMVLVLIYAKLAVAVHRSVLLGNQSIKDLLTFKWADLKFFMGILAVFAIVMLLFWLFITIFVQTGLINPKEKGSTGLITLLMYIVIGVIGARLALLFPAIAINNQINLIKTWLSTRKQKTTLFFLIVLFPLMFSTIVNKIPEDTVYWLIFGSVVSVLVVMFEVVILSHCYSELMLKNNPNNSDYNNPIREINGE